MSCPPLPNPAGLVAVVVVMVMMVVVMMAVSDVDNDLGIRRFGEWNSNHESEQSVHEGSHAG